MTSTRSKRTKVPLNKRHLARLSKIAAADHESFYARRPEYQGRLIAVVLAQGAALHYLDRSNGVKDLDVWSFFALPVEETRFPEDQRKKHVDFGPSDLGRQRYDLKLAMRRVDEPGSEGSAGSGVPAKTIRMPTAGSGSTRAPTRRSAARRTSTGWC